MTSYYHVSHHATTSSPHATMISKKNTGEKHVLNLGIATNSWSLERQWPVEDTKVKVSTTARCNLGIRKGSKSPLVHFFPLLYMPHIIIKEKVFILLVISKKS